MIKKRATGYLLQDIGLVLVLLCIGIMAVTVGNAGEELLLEFSIMLMASFFAVLLAGFKLSSLSVVVAGFAVVLYTAYKLYFYYAMGEDIALLCYVWIVMPIFAVGAMQMFVSGNRRTELENDVLKEQVDELVMVNSLTGLYNLRSLYNDLKRQIAYAERNKNQICLLIVTLRYEQELRSVLSRSHYEALLQKMAEIVVDAVRLEDRVYSIDNKGGIAAILTCDQAGSEFVKRRIKSHIEADNAFAGITDGAVRVEVKMACLEYNKELYENNLIAFKQKVESELQYDV